MFIDCMYMFRHAQSSASDPSHLDLTTHDSPCLQIWPGTDSELVLIAVIQTQSYKRYACTIILLVLSYQFNAGLLQESINNEHTFQMSALTDKVGTLKNLCQTKVHIKKWVLV